MLDALCVVSSLHCSLRAPRMGTRERQPDPWAVDAREFLRKKLIGREVQVKMEYNRKVPSGGEVLTALMHTRTLLYCGSLCGHLHSRPTAVPPCALPSHAL